MSGENPQANKVVKAKLDTLEMTYKIIKRRSTLTAQKYAEIEYTHLRIAKELNYCLAGVIAGGKGKGKGSGGGKTGTGYYVSGAQSYDDEFDSRYALYTGGWGGGHLYNRNWVSACIPYDEVLDYEYVDEVFPFDESNQLPTALF